MIKSASLKHHWDYRERLDGKVGAAGGLEQECRAEGVRVWRAQESGSAEQAGCETCDEMRVGGLHDWPDAWGGRESRPG